ncbi:MAG: tetratricopeptide repeat protein [Chitinophagaceae bacterium]
MDNFDDSSLDWKEVLKRYQLFKNKKNIYFTEDEIESLVLYLQALGRSKDALSFIEWGISQYPYAVGIRIDKANILISSKKIKEAFFVLQQVYNLRQDSIDFYILTSEIYLIKEEYAKALEVFTTSLSIFKTDKEEFSDLLSYYVDLFSTYEKFDILLDGFCKVLDQPSLVNEEIMFTFAVFVEKTKRYKESIPYYQQFIDKHPFNSSTWFNLANAYQQLKLYEKAIDTYLYAIAIEDEFELAYIELSVCYIKIRQYHQASIYLDHLVNECKLKDIELLKKLAYCQYKNKEYGKAIKNYLQVLQLDSSDHATLFQLAQIEYKGEQYQKAYYYIKEAIAIFPKKGAYYYLCGQCFLKLNNLQDALKYFSQATVYKTKQSKYWESFLIQLLQTESFQQAKETATTAIFYTQRSYFVYFLIIAFWELNQKKKALEMMNHILPISYKESKNLKKLLPLLPIQEELKLLITSNIEKYL